MAAYANLARLKHLDFKNMVRPNILDKK